MLRIDLQTHTNRSQGCGWMSPDTLVRRAAKIGLNGVAVTDHNTMDGVGPAQRAAGDDFLVIPAEEIDTPEGQIIGLFLSDPIEPWGSPVAVIDRIHDQGGVAFAPHPFDAMREGLTTIADHVESLDAVETLNSRCVQARYNERARQFAAAHELAKTGGSDAHFALEVGTAYTRVRTDERTLGAVKAALLSGDVSAAGERGSIVVHVGTKGVKLYNRIRER